jgi:hypothetical protein
MGFLDSFTPQELESAQEFSSFQIGDNIARITRVEESYSHSGNDMLVIHFENESGAKIRHYIVSNEWKLQKLKSLYLAFGIPFYEKNPQKWIGKRGIVVCKQGKPYNGESRPEVNYVRPLPKDTAGQDHRQEPAQTPPPGYSKPANPPSDDGFDDDIPF